MKLRLRGFKSADGQGFKEVIEDAARNAGLSDDQMLLYMSHFIEALADRVSRGSIVTIPGFGKLAACYTFHHKSGRRMRPRFVAHAGLRHQVSLCAPISSKGNHALGAYAGKNSYDNASLTSRPFKAMEKIRDDIRAQMAQD